MALKLEASLAFSLGGVIGYLRMKAFLEIKLQEAFLEIKLGGIFGFQSERE